MNNEEKILEILIQVQDTQKQMQTEMSQMREDVQHIKDRLSRVEELGTRTAVTQETVVLPAIDALVEGQELTHQMMKGLATNRKVEGIRDEVEILHTVVALHSREIEELKKAQ